MLTILLDIVTGGEEFPLVLKILVDRGFVGEDVTKDESFLVLISLDVGMV